MRQQQLLNPARNAHVLTLFILDRCQERAPSLHGKYRHALALRISPLTLCKDRVSTLRRIRKPVTNPPGR